MSMNRGDKRAYRSPTGVLSAAPLSDAVLVGDLIFLSGQIGLDESGKLVHGGAAAETRMCLQKIKQLLESYGASLSDIAQIRAYLTDFSQYAAYNEAYREFIAAPFPTRATIGASELAFGATIETEAIAAMHE